ncbi:MAG: hypothetical protein J3R72DRAFT_458590, partial [Linnemannia gamsii]
MEGILHTLPQGIDELKRQEEKYWRQLQQADNDRRSREAILRHLQPYIETERLRQQQQQVQQLQQQYRLQQQLLSQQQKRLAEELEWIRLHQQKQTAAIGRQQQQQQQQKKKKDVVLAENMTRVGVNVWNPQHHEGQAVLTVERHQQDTSNWFTLSKDHEQPQQSYAQEDQQRQRQAEVEHQLSREQAELDERQRVERDEIWQLYKLRKQQEQQLVEERQRRYLLQPQQQAILSDKLQQQACEIFLQYEPSSRKASEPMEPGPTPVQESNLHEQQLFIQPFISSTLPSWDQALNSNHIENQAADEDDDDEANEGQDHPGQHYNSHQEQSQQYDWRGLRRISKIYTPIPRCKRGRKGRGDLFEDDYHAGYNKIEIQALSTAGKAAYEAQRQMRQQHDEPTLDLEKKSGVNGGEY